MVETMRARELLACPFCGDLARMEVHGGQLEGAPGYRVECQGRCHAMTCYWHTRKEAVEAWNTRALSDRETIRAEAFEAAAEVAELYARRDWESYDPHTIAAAIRALTKEPTP